MWLRPAVRRVIGPSTKAIVSSHSRGTGETGQPRRRSGRTRGCAARPQDATPSCRGPEAALPTASHRRPRHGNAHCTLARDERIGRGGVPYSLSRPLWATLPGPPASASAPLPTSAAGLASSVALGRRRRLGRARAGRCTTSCGDGQVWPPPPRGCGVQSSSVPGIPQAGLPNYFRTICARGCQSRSRGPCGTNHVPDDSGHEKNASGTGTGHLGGPILRPCHPRTVDELCSLDLAASRANALHDDPPPGRASSCLRPLSLHPRSPSFSRPQEGQSEQRHCLLLVSC